MKKISLFIFGMFAMLGLSANVLAIGSLGEGFQGGSSSNNTVTSETTNGITGWNNGDPNITYGIRISFVEASGKDIYSVDYLLHKGLNFRLDYTTEVHSKPHYTNRYSTINFVKPTDGKIRDFNSFNSFINLAKKYNFNITPGYLKGESNGKTYTYAYNISSASEWFSKASHDDKSGNSYDDDLLGFLKEIIPNYDAKDEEKLKRLFLVIEPTSMVYFKINNKFQNYYGTAYELSLAAANVYEAYNTTRYGHTALSIMSDLLGKNLPCSSYLSGELIKGIEKAGYDIKEFKTNYFTNIAPNKDCPISKYLEKNIITGDHGVGMAVVWFYDKVTQKNQIPNCDIIGLHGLEPGASFKDYDKTKTPDGILQEIVHRYNNWAEENKYEKTDVNYIRNNCLYTGPNDNKYSCKPDYSVGSCLDPNISVTVKYDDTNGRVDDKDYWNQCVFDNLGTYEELENKAHKTSEGTYPYLDRTLGDEDICPVYCVEELSAVFDKNLVSVNAGQFFTFGNGSKITGTRTCKSKELDVKEIEKKLKKLNDDVTTAYAEYMLEKKKEKHIETVPNGCTVSSENCTMTTSHNETFYCTTLPGTADMPNCEEKYNELKCSNYVNYYDADGYDKEKKIKFTECHVNANQPINCQGENAYQDKKIVQSQSYTLSSPTKTVKSNKIEWCEGKNSPIDVKAKEKSYLNAINTLESFIESLKKCYKWDINNVYNVDSNLKITSNNSENKYTLIDELLVREIEYVDHPAEYIGQSTKPISYYSSCSDSKCTLTTTDVKLFKQVTMSRSAVQTFYLDGNLFRYVSKEISSTDELMSTSKLPDNMSKYIDIGFGNIPVSFNTPDGSYDISISYDGLGHTSAKFGEQVSTVLDSILNTVDVNRIDENDPNGYKMWSCKYDVVSTLIEDPCTGPSCTNDDDGKHKYGGIRLIYRPIDLNNPFPDINAKGRSTGSNWCNGNDCSFNNDVVKKVITDKKDIMSKTPMYSVTLTPSMIKQIRVYNAANEYDDRKLSCVPGTGKNCISDFVTALIKGESISNNGATANLASSYNVTGVCTINREAKVGFFDSCRAAQK